jgi:hypothetical protein
MATDLQRRWSNSHRNSKPPKHSTPKLTPQQRSDITQRLAAGEKATVLALEYGVTAGRIRELR